MKEIKLLDQGYVRLILTYGSDQDVIEDARMSTDKGFQGWEHDERLLNYLYTHKHMTPFEGSGMKIEVKAPILVFREWQRHRTQAYNEMSGRYVELPNENYLPSVERIHNGAGQAWKAKSKQAQARDGAQNSLSWYQAEIARKEIAGMQYMQEIHYQKLLAMGLPKELARINIPVSRYSRMRATASLRNWLAFLTLREDPSAQWEIRQYAHAVSTLILENFPRTHALYIGAK
jgi:thymidylate synthase (FAD)